MRRPGVPARIAENQRRRPCRSSHGRTGCRPQSPRPCSCATWHIAIRTAAYRRISLRERLHEAARREPSRSKTDILRVAVAREPILRMPHPPPLILGYSMFLRRSPPPEVVAIISIHGRREFGVEFVPTSDATARHPRRLDLTFDDVEVPLPDDTLSLLRATTPPPLGRAEWLGRSRTHPLRRRCDHRLRPLPRRPLSPRRPPLPLRRRHEPRPRRRPHLPRDVERPRQPKPNACRISAGSAPAPRRTSASSASPMKSSAAKAN
jgi:hypothetical protein